MRHMQAGVEVVQVFVRFVGQGFRRDGGQGPVEVVDRFEQVRGEFLDGELPRRAYVALRALLEVSEVGYGAEVFVLFMGAY